MDVIGNRSRFSIAWRIIVCEVAERERAYRLSQELSITPKRDHASIGYSIQRRARSSRVSAIVHLGLAIVTAAGIWACRHAESDPSTPTGNPAVGRWQAEIFNSSGRRQKCSMEIGDTGQISYGDSCPMPLTGQRGTITSVPNGAYAPNLYETGKDSGTFMITGGSISGMVGAFRIEGSKHMTTRTALGADIEWTRSSSEVPMQNAAASQLLPRQIQWPLGGVPAIAQSAVAYVRAKWQPDAFLTAIQMELTTDVSNAQSPEGGVLVEFNFYSPGQQQTLSFMPNSPAGELIPGSSADPRDQRALPASFMDLPDAVAKLRAKGLRGKRIKTAHLENYGRGSYAAGSIGVFGTEWVINSALDEQGVVLAQLPDQNDVRLYNSDQVQEGGQSENLIHVKIAGLRNNRGQVYCELFQSAASFPSNTSGNAASTASTIRNRRAGCNFENQDPGAYAIVVFHDEDSSHVLELNPNGAPREGVGLSNNPTLLSGLPGYDAAMFPYRTGVLNLTINVQYPSMQASGPTQSFTASADANASLVGFAFVDNSVTGQGSRAQLPSGTKIYPPGSTITGTDGCPTTRYRTDGMIVAVIDYQGRPTAGSVAVTRRPVTGGVFHNAPYYLDLDSGRTLQFLGPIFENGSYNVRFQYDFNLGQGHKLSAGFSLARSCPP
jgi:uncharacterized protein (DUF2141 family)